ncbi:MAG: potassium channel protein [Candidatus Bipolaricaulota bacterium]
MKTRPNPLPGVFRDGRDRRVFHKITTELQGELKINPNRSDLKNLLLRIITILLVLMAVGTAGYMTLEGWNALDSFYMVILTITTTGYGEVWPLSTAGRVLSIFLMVTGVGTVFYSLNVIIPTLVGRRIERWKRMLKELDDHYIICGYTDVGQRISDELSDRNEKDKILFVDPDGDKVSLAREKGYQALQGQPSDESTLGEARIERARSLVATMDDSENAFSVMVAKDLNPDIYAIALSHSASASKNIRRAGADYVLSPYLDTAKKASLLLHNPIAADVTEVISEIAEVGMLQKISLKETALSGQTLKELDLGAKTGALIIAVEREGKIIPPSPGLKVQTGDGFYLVGSEEELTSAGGILLD